MEIRGCVEPRRVAIEFTWHLLLKYFTISTASNSLDQSPLSEALTVILTWQNPATHSETTGKNTKNKRRQYQQITPQDGQNWNLRCELWVITNLAVAKRVFRCNY